MAKSSRSQSLENRLARQERAQALALGEIQMAAAYRRERSNALRELRLKRDNESAEQFTKWRETQS